MALKLIKLHATASTTTTAVPTNTRFFYETVAEIAAGNTLTIDAASFQNDAGDLITALPDLSLNNNYFNVYINGFLQMEGISTYTAGATGVGKLEIAVPAGGDPILNATPIVLELVQYAPASSTTILT